MKKALVVVESPAKAKTINKYLGKDYVVQASVGHVRDLPKSRLGIDLDKKFDPDYVLLRNKGKVLRELRKAAKNSETVLLALDPDREGEAIAWHVAEELKEANPNIYRILFYEITKKAVHQAIENRIEIDLHKVHAQQARRIMDRLMGYKISPFLWSKVRKGLSAGRVQSVALRLICDREREIRAFEQEEYWTLHAELAGSKKPAFQADLVKIKGKKAAVPDEKHAKKIEENLKGKDWLLKKIHRRQRIQKPKPPFITSTMQQEASRRLRLAASRTMRIAQELYEGIEVGEEGLVGLITYMRTDSTRVSDDALKEVREYIGTSFGKDFVPGKPLVYAKSKKAQDAHEAIRPTSVLRTPDSLKKTLTADQFKLYKLIWERFVSCQMAPAKLDSTRFDIEVGDYIFRATGSIVTFEGFLKLYHPSTEEQEEAGEQSLAVNAKRDVLPELKEGEKLKNQSTESVQHFTQPPPRFNEASLIRELEKQGIGRPSTYATILHKIQDRSYTTRSENHFIPTELGFVVTDILVKYFSNVLDIGFTAQLEEKLDDVEEGNRDWAELVQTFYEPFAENLENATEKAEKVEGGLAETNIPCDKCDTHMVIKVGRNGEFLACPRYPECSGTRNFKRDKDGNILVEANEQLDEECPECKKALEVKSSRGSRFIGCSGYPECTYTRPFSIGVGCPEENCEGDLAERQSKRGRIFYGCTRYPDCKFTSWQKPIPKPCPECKHPFLVEKRLKSKGLLNRCPKKGCDYELSVEEQVPA